MKGTTIPANSTAFEQALRESVKGDVAFDDVTRGIYATDASIYQIMPVAVVMPKDESDVRAAVKAAAAHDVTVLPRGGGTSLAGQCVSPSMVMDFTKHMDQVIELNTDERWVRVQPGIVLDALNAYLAPHGLHFAPDPATSSRATIGGMIGNNSSGTRSIVYGLTRDHVLELKVLTADGTILELKEHTPAEYDELVRNGSPREAQILGSFKTIIEENRDEIQRRFPKVMRRVLGYSLDLFANAESWNLAKLVVGSEGTLAVVLEAKLNLEPLPKHKSLCTIHYADMLDAIRSVQEILEHGPSAVEIMDEEVVTLGRKNLSTAPLCGFIEGDPKAILMVEFFAESDEEADDKAKRLVADMRKKSLGYAWPIMATPQEQAPIWALRKSGLGLILGMKGDRKPIPFIEDCCVPVEVLADYVGKILAFCEERDVPVALYAHASVGTIHIRPILNLKTRDDIDHFKAISEFAFGLVTGYGGAWSGEHGDGRVRSPYLERFFGAQVYNAFREVKKLFDPEGVMNPGPIIDPNPIDQDLRLGTKYNAKAMSTHYHYREDGNFAAAVEMCTGIGACRQRLVGSMCPSYRATLDEENSTRGRANALRLAMSGQLGPDGMNSKRLYEVMALCLSCKSCKSECPSNVDMARLKSEFLQQYYDTHGTSLRDRMIANVGKTATQMAGWKAPIVNAVQGSGLFRKSVEAIAGFDSRRKLPTLTSQPFKKWFKQRPKPKNTFTRKVVLFDDTYMNGYEPRVGISAVELLESCGYEVIPANAGCCQRPKISHGFLREAKVAGEATLRNLDAWIQQGLKIVVCEPSCCSALTDDLPDLIDDEQLGERIKANVMMIDVFLANEIADGTLEATFTSPFKKLLVHGHCHQKALYGTQAMASILASIPEISVAETDAGCCGMAGSFGYEKEHYDLSMQIGEERLFPAVRALDKGEAVIACGFSCRHHIADGTGTKAIHWVEALRAHCRSL